MKATSPITRWLPAAITVTVFATVVIGVAWTARPPSAAGVPMAKPQASEWPMLGGSAGRNMVNTIDRDLPTDWTVEWQNVRVNGRDERVLHPRKSRNVKWVVKVGSRSYGGPVVAGGKVLVGTNNKNPRDVNERGDRGILMCFRAADGEFLWQAVHHKLASGQVNDWPNQGLTSTPAVEGNRVYYVSNRCELVCVDLDGDPRRKEARTLWVLDMFKDLGVFPHNMSHSSPVVAGQYVFALTGNGVDEEHVNLGAPRAASFVAVNKHNGRVLWRDGSPGKDILHGQWASPASTSVQVVFPAGDGWLYSFERASGKLLWKFDANPKDSKYQLSGQGTRSDFIAAPVIVGDRCYIGTGQDPEHYEGVGHLWCIDITRTGDVSPELVVSAKPLKMKPNPNSAVIWHYGGPARKGEPAAFKRDYYFGRTMSTVAVHDGLVYAAELAGYLHCLDAATGKPYWVHDLKSSVWGSPYWADGRVYMPTEDGDVWIFPHGKQKPAPDRVEMGQVIRSTPVAADGVLYILTESHLYALAKPSGR